MTGSGEADVLLCARGVGAERGGREVLRAVDLELTVGETVVVMGPNGAGKSTLLESLAGLLPASTGAVRSRGRVALALQTGDLARRTALENVMLALAWWRVAPAERAPRARAALDSLGAGHLADRPTRTLSGGERRRVHLARALAVRPDVLLLDEPFAGLDAPGRAALLEDAGAAIRSFARAAIVVVHHRAEAWALADRLVVLLGGQIAASGPPAELLEAPPSPAVARFLGFDGQITDRGEALLTRPEHVRIAADGPRHALVTRAIPLEDRVRLELTMPEGRVYADAPLPGPRRDERVGVQLAGGVRFSVAEVAQGTVAADAQPVIPS